MAYQYRDAVADDLPRIVEIYNFAVATRTCSCDLEPTTVDKRRASFAAHTPHHRPLWVAEDSELPGQGAIGYLGAGASCRAWHDWRAWRRTCCWWGAGWPDDDSRQRRKE